MITSNMTVLTWVAWLSLAFGAVVTVSALLRAGREGLAPSNSPWADYPFHYMGFYLTGFFLLWTIGLGDYLAAENGITSDGAYIGSIEYVLGCYAFSLFFIFQFIKARNNASAATAGATVGAT